MVKRLRYKFVFVTMSLMVSVFGVLFLVDFFHSKYWNEIDTLQVLEWMADSGSFYDVSDINDTSDNAMEGNPIYAVFIDDQGQIIEIKSSSRSSTPSISDGVIEEILRKGAEHWRWHSYVYTSRELSDGNSLLLLTDTSEHSISIGKALGTISLIVLGFLLLLGVSFYLSRFVTEPAKKALEREKQFISDASHELKTPVAAISINVQALKCQIEENKHLNHIVSETERMDKLIQRLLTLSYIEEKERRIEKKDFSLSVSCEEIALTLESVAFEKKIKFEYEIEENISYYGNSDEIKQVFAILLDNAIKYTPELGRINLKLFSKNNHPTLKVFNTGEGIAPDELQHIFERFYCTEKSRNNRMNSYGLGLAIAKAIVEAHDGEITVKSTYGSNTCFTIIF